MSTQANFTATRDLLASAGIPVLGQIAGTREQAVIAAKELGFPCVMKLVSAEVVHKTDAGVVILDIDSPWMAGESYDTILANGRTAGAREIEGVLVQRQAKPGFELLIGARQDPVFGPLTMVGY
ncbi:MAG TPA: acetate--CoA ligase family protein, partial [Candidatus Sulfotelmatobacter sp.]|nr:acetate--CoA ligase family protein [Candidatus Sulfotelmatobacter sp.]